MATGTKLWLDSIDPDLVRRDFAAGATGATSNPIIVADLVASGRCDDLIDRLVQQGRSDEQIAWELTDQLVRDAQERFSARLGADRRQRRLCEFRGGSAVGRPGVESATPASRGAIY